MALGLQLWRDPEFPYNWATNGLDFSMIWYAASLVPKVVVIGIGVRLLLLAVVATVLSMCIASATLLLLQKWKLAKSWAADEGQADVAGYFLNRWEHLNKWERRFWHLSWVVLLPLVLLWLWSEFPFDTWYDLPFLGGYFIFSALGGLECVAKPARERMVTTLTLRRTLTTRPGLARVERHATTSRHGGRLRRAAASPMIGK